MRWGITSRRVWERKVYLTDAGNEPKAKAGDSSDLWAQTLMSQSRSIHSHLSFLFNKKCPNIPLLYKNSAVPCFIWPKPTCWRFWSLGDVLINYSDFTQQWPQCSKVWQKYRVLLSENWVEGSDKRRYKDPTFALMRKKAWERKGEKSCKTTHWEEKAGNYFSPRSLIHLCSVSPLQTQ